MTSARSVFIALVGATGVALVVPSITACSSGDDRPIDPPAADSSADVVVDAGADALGDASDGGDGTVRPALPTGVFAIGFWCGVPAAQLAQSRFDEIAAAGFTFVTNPCEGSTTVAYNTQMLAFASKSKVGAIVTDSRMAAALAGTDVAGNLDRIVADYATLPGLYGYHVVDEPSAPSFGTLAVIRSGLATRDKAHFAFVNLLPNYATGDQLGTATYDAYVAKFLEAVAPAVVSYDHYNFFSDGTDGAGFFDNLAIVRSNALAKKTAFWQIIQSISFNGHRPTTGPEKRWAALHTLAYGAAGLMYFTYWTPPVTPENFGSGIIDATGAKTTQYAEVTAINASLTSMGKYLVKATSTAVFHDGPLSSNTVPRAAGAPVYLPSTAAITVGLFSQGDDVLALLANRDYKATTESDVYVTSIDGAPKILDVASGKFVAATVLDKGPNGARLHVKLPPGDGVLLHLPGPVPAGAPGAEAFVGSVRADAGFLDVVDSSFGAQRLRGAGWNDCPTGTTMIGRDFQSNGFWLCARNDLATRTFYVGNVVADAGTAYRVQGGKATSIGAASWDTCAAGKLLGHRFERNGFWVCLE